METPEDMVKAYKDKQKNKMNEEDYKMIKAISTYEVDDIKKIVRELHSISKELNTLNNILRRMK